MMQDHPRSPNNYYIEGNRHNYILIEILTNKHKYNSPVNKSSSNTSEYSESVSVKL